MATKNEEIQDIGNLREPLNALENVPSSSVIPTYIDIQKVFFQIIEMHTNIFLPKGGQHVIFIFNFYFKTF